MNRRSKGDFAEVSVERRAIQKGWIVSRPGGQARYDLVLDDGDRLYRAQVKYAGGKASSNADGAVGFTCNNGPRTPKTYTEADVDVILVYVPQLDAVVWVSPEHFVGRTSVSIRLKEAKNGQRSGCFMAADHIW